MENIEAMLCAYIEGDLDEKGRAQIEKHLSERPETRRLIEQLLATRAAVRALPRVPAPREVAESLRAQGERSMLLGGQGEDMRPKRAPRWTQWAAIAAVFILCVALAFLIFQTIVPNVKPGQLTRVNPATAPAEPQAMSEQFAAAVPATEPANGLATTEPTMEQTIVATTAPIVAAVAGPASNPSSAENGATVIAANTPVSVEPAAPVIHPSTESSQTRLQAMDLGRPGQVVVVINSVDPTETDRQIARFLDQQSGVTWHEVSAAASQPARDFALLDRAASEQPMAKASTMPATRPGGTFVAAGMTPELADLLRQTVMGQQEVRDYKQLSPTSPATQPAPATPPAEEIPRVAIGGAAAGGFGGGGGGRRGGGGRGGRGGRGGAAGAAMTRRSSSNPATVPSQAMEVVIIVQAVDQAGRNPPATEPATAPSNSSTQP